LTDCFDVLVDVDLHGDLYGIGFRRQPGGGLATHGDKDGVLVLGLERGGHLDVARQVEANGLPVNCVHDEVVRQENGRIVLIRIVADLRPAF
jgi:hypothetical protein